MSKFLIDSDLIVYRAGFAAQRTVYYFQENGGNIEPIRYDRPLTEVKKILKTLGHTRETGKLSKVIEVYPVSHALQITKTILESIYQFAINKGFSTWDLYLTSDDKSNFRYSLATTIPYKGNRKAPRPSHYEAIREYLITYHNAKIIYGQEADDELGIQATKYPNSWIVSIDKDLKQVPGYHYDFVKMEEIFFDDIGFLELSDDKRKLKGVGIKFFFAQVLLGDSADNVPGLLKYGPVNVFRVLKDCNTFAELYNMVYLIYERRDLIARFEEVTELLFIRRVPNQTFKEFSQQYL